MKQKQKSFNQKEHLLKIANQQQICVCEICNETFLKSNSLAVHVKYIHNISSQEYYDRLNPKANKICACGNKLPFKTILRGYNKKCSSACSISVSGKNNPMYGKHQSKKVRKAQSKMMFGNKFGIGNHSNKGISKTFTEEHKTNIRKHLHDNINSKGLNIKNGARCKWFEIAGMRVQGKWEFAYITKLLKNNKPIPTQPDTIKTPYGFYTPDFEFENSYIEVKSTYTIITCFKSKQFKKIKWVSKNIKKVDIIILSEKEVKQLLYGKIYR